MATNTKRGGKQPPFTQEELRHWLTQLTLMDDEFLEACFRGNNEGAELLLRIILGDDALRVQMGQQALKVTETYSEETVMAQWTQCFQKLLA